MEGGGGRRRLVVVSSALIKSITCRIRIVESFFSFGRTTIPPFFACQISFKRQNDNILLVKTVSSREGVFAFRYDSDFTKIGSSSSCNNRIDKLTIEIGIV